MNKLTVAILALALTGSVAFAQGQGGGRGGNRGGQQGGGRGNRGGQAGQVQPGGAGGAGGMMGGQGGFGGQGGMMGGQGGGRGGNRGGQQGGGRGNRGGGQGGMGQGGMGQGGFGQGGMGNFGGFGQGGMGQGGFGQGGMGPGMGQGGMGPGMGQGGMMGAPRNGQLQQTIDRLTAETPREQALKKLEAKDKEAYNKIQKDLADANAKLLELAKKAEIELPETAEQQKAKTLEFLAKEKDAIDKLLETDKTDSASAMRDFTELAQKNQISLTPAGGRGALAGQAGRRTQPGAGGANSSAIRQIQEKFPEEYNEAQKLRDTDPTGYRTRMRELQQKLNAAN